MFWTWTWKTLKVLPHALTLPSVCNLKHWFLNCGNCSETLTIDASSIFSYKAVLYKNGPQNLFADSNTLYFFHLPTLPQMLADLARMDLGARSTLASFPVTLLHGGGNRAGAESETGAGADRPTAARERTPAVPRNEYQRWGLAAVQEVAPAGEEPCWGDITVVLQHQQGCPLCKKARTLVNLSSNFGPGSSWPGWLNMSISPKGMSWYFLILGMCNHCDIDLNIRKPLMPLRPVGSSEASRQSYNNTKVFTHVWCSVGK